MYEKLSVFEDKLIELEKDLSSVEVINDSKLYQQKAIEHAEIEPIVTKYRAYKETLNSLNENKELIKEKLDDDFKDLVREEINEATKKVEELENELKILLIPKDKNDSKNVMVEIRAGAGGDEAALFAGVLYRQYVRYAERSGFRVETI